MKKAGWGFDVRDIDQKVRPQDDFYHYANGDWLKRNPVPPHESAWGSFKKLRYDTDKKLQALVGKVRKINRVENGTPAQMIRDFYRSGTDLARRKNLGLSPLKDILERIEKIQIPHDIVRAVAELEKKGVSIGAWSSGVEQDIKDSERYILYLGQGGLGMPDRDYYLKNDSESKRIRTVYVKHLEKLAVLTGHSREAKRRAAIMMRIETALARASMKKEDLRDVDKTYHKMRVEDLARIAPRIDWNTYFKTTGARSREIVVMQPTFFKTVEKLYFSIPIEEWKIYLSTHIVGDYGNLLTLELEKENFRYHQALSGAKRMKPLWRRVLGVVNGNLDEILGKLYVSEYFSARAKKKVGMIVDDLFAAYDKRIRNLDWMTPATKRKAITKLYQMHRKLGYPDKWKKYTGLVIAPRDYVGNALRVAAFEHRRAMKRLAKPVDHTEWFMSPQTVNAYCSFTMNDIVFPAAILQAPFFDLDVDDAINYGCIGSVIGHEITHGFDDQGSKFDGKGNRKVWWTKTDRGRFIQKARKVEEQFNRYAVADNVKVNGKLTLGENIADLGGASIAFDAYAAHLRRAPSKNIDGFTPEQRFFLGFALFERENVRPESQKTQVLTDPHSPSVFRVNGPLSNLPEFYEAFGVKKGDKLYREPKDRAKIW